MNIYSKNERQKYIFDGAIAMIATQIKAMRIKKGITQQQLATDVGVKEQIIAEMETGKSIDLKILRKIAKYFDVALLVRFSKSSDGIALANIICPISFKEEVEVEK